MGGKLLFSKLETGRFPADADVSVSVRTMSRLLFTNVTSHISYGIKKITF